MCGVTVIPARELPSVVQKLSAKDVASKMNGFEQEYKTLQTVVPKLTVGECAGGHRAENRRKSRDIMLQPPERARPYLITHDSNDSTDYINAVYVDGYGHTNAYIVTQWPLRSTVNDIWRLIYDYNIPTIVLLNDMPNSRSYPTFWPTEIRQEVPFGPLTVELEYEEEEKHVTSRVFRIRKTLVSLQAMSTSTEESARQVKMFQLKSWPNSQKVPSSAASLIDLLTKVEEWQINSCHGRIPTCVISKNGVSRCGVYCSVSMAWDKLKSDGEVDVFHAVKTVKTNRPQLVENLVEFIYCYTFLVVMVEILRATDPNLIPCPTAEPPAQLVVETDSKRSGAKNKLSPLSLDPAFPRQLEVKNKNSKDNTNRQSFIKQAQQSQKAKTQTSNQKENQNAIPTVSIEMEDMAQKGRKTRKAKVKPKRKDKQAKTQSQNETELYDTEKTVVLVHDQDGARSAAPSNKTESTPNDPALSDRQQGQQPPTSGHFNKAFETDDQTNNTDSLTGSATGSQTETCDMTEDNATSVKV